MPPTLKDIAKAAGVSISTVSKALNESEEIRRETRERIVRIARDLKYNIERRNANKNKSGLIGVICPEVNSDYYARLVNSIGENIARKGYFFVIGITDFNEEREESFLRLFKRQELDGIIFITENPNAHKIIDSAGQETEIPIIFIANETDTKDFDCIKIDDGYGVKLAVDHLLRLGHRDIAYIGDSLTTGRRAAFLEAMKSGGVEIKYNLIRESDRRFEEGGYAAMKNLLCEKRRPTAVFAAYDNMAIGAMRAIGETGLDIPGDISIIGFDNIAVDSYLVKSLSTISNPVRDMAEASVSLLIKK